MIPKVAQYNGFQSYGDLPYSSLKPGHVSLDYSDKWEKSVREQDNQKFYSSYNRLNSVNNMSYKDNINQSDYVNKSTMPRGTDGYMKISLDQKESQLVGTQHWKSTYNSSLTKPQETGIVKRADWTEHQQPYKVQGSDPQSEYKTIFGKFGSQPEKVQSRYHQREIMLENELKLGKILQFIGTGQMSKHTPGYQGFIPATKQDTKAFKQSIGESTRDTFLKQNIIQNYKQKIPNYAGHDPQHYSNQKGQFRDQFFSTKGETYM